MKITALWFALLTCVMTSTAFACPANGGKDDFLAFRDGFMRASLKGEPGTIVHFYHFPIEGGGVTEDDRALKISKKTFLAHYDAIFVKSLTNGKSRLYRELAETQVISPSILSRNLASDGCISASSLLHGIGERNYFYKLIEGTWKVTEVEFQDDYDDVVQKLKARGIKPW